MDASFLGSAGLWGNLRTAGDSFNTLQSCDVAMQLCYRFSGVQAGYLHSQVVCHSFNILIDFLSKQSYKRSSQELAVLYPANIRGLFQN